MRHGTWIVQPDGSLKAGLNPRADKAKPKPPKPKPAAKPKE